MVRSQEIGRQMRIEARTQLLDAARKLFAGQGYFNTRITDIAREAGMSQGNLYWYFSGKQDVLQAILGEGFENLEAALAQARAHPGAAGEKLDFLIERYLHTAREGYQFFTIFVSLLGHGGVDFLRELGFDTLAIGRRLHEHLGAILVQARSEGMLDGEADPQALAAFFFAFFNGLMITYGEDWLDLPPEMLRLGALRLLGVRTE